MTKPVFRIKSPQWLWYILGSFAACSLPVTYGLVSLLTRPHYDIFIMSIPLTFIFGTFLAASIGVYKVKGSIDDIEKPIGFGVIGIQSASWAHLTAAMVHLLCMLVGPFTTISIDFLLILLIYGSFTHFGLWVCITLPLSLLCGMIFKWVAVEPA